MGGMGAVWLGCQTGKRPATIFDGQTPATGIGGGGGGGIWVGASVGRWGLSLGRWGLGWGIPPPRLRLSGDRDLHRGGGGVGTRPRYLIVCLWQRLLASRHCSFCPGGGGGGSEANKSLCT